VNQDSRVRQRRAIEALRSGVPNRDAVLALGCAQPEIESKFRQQLQATRASALGGRQVPGMLVAGDFGTGKSHLFEYLQDLALGQNFICSKIVISKETPLYDPVKLYRAAIEAARVPKKLGAALNEVALALDPESKECRDLVDWVHAPAVGLNARFGATLYLFLHIRQDPEASDRIIRFWSGDEIGVGELKQYLRACGEAATYRIDKIGKRDLALQRFAFTPRLMLAAGYSGWVLLIDEVELVGRYSLLQRAKSYAELARWVGRQDSSDFAGLTAVLAMTDDFVPKVLEGKEDLDKVPGKLRARGSELDRLLASQAEEGMRLIQLKRNRLNAPDPAVIQQTYDKLRAIHGQAFDWEPPPALAVKRLTTTRMREYVKGWITEWDLMRIDPTYRVELERTEMRPVYTEDRTLEVPSEEEADALPE
jgi:hypothetical protein